MIEARTTLYEDDRAFLLAFVDDTEESPWMVAADYHLRALNAAVLPVRLYLASRRPDLYSLSLNMYPMKQRCSANHRMVCHRTAHGGASLDGVLAVLEQVRVLAAKALP